MKKMTMTQTVMISILALFGSSFGDTMVVNLTGSINGEPQWSSGLPSPTNPGTIGLDGNWLNGLDFNNWVVTQNAGTITRTSGHMQMIGSTVWDLNGGTLHATNGMIRIGTAVAGNGATLNMTGGSILAYTTFDLPNSATTVNMSGGSVTAANMQMSGGSKANISGGSGTFSGTLTLGNAGTQLVMTGGDLTFSGDLILTSTASLSTYILFGAGNGSLSVGGLSLDGTGFVGFTSDSAGSLTVNGYTQSDFQNLWDTQRLRLDGVNDGTFTDHFSVSGDTLSVIPEPGTTSLVIISGGILWFLRAQRR